MGIDHLADVCHEKVRVEHVHDATFVKSVEL